MRIDATAVIRSLEQLVEQTPKAVVRSVTSAGRDLLQTVRQNVSRPWQAVPSYLLEHQSSDLNPKVYPPGTVATFARSASGHVQISNVEDALGDASLEEFVQQYPEGPHLLHEDLTATTADASNLRDIHVDVGYPEGEGDEGRSRYIRFVYFGTAKMIPRPFLEESVDEHRYLDHLVTDIQTALDEVG